MPLLEHAFRITVGIITLVLLGACSPQRDVSSGSSGFHDPYERQNRNVHAFNRGLDRAIVRPAGRGYTSVLPDEVEDSVNNFASNLGEPSNVVNNLLQGKLKNVGISTGRFVINTVLGFGGLFDAASEFGVSEVDTDFGETLHVWGVKEGAYLELPVAGPSTQRDTAGMVVDLFTNPLSYVLDSPERYYGPLAGGVSRIGDRGRFTDTIDDILYESADSYAQARLIYLQNRRFELGQADASSEIDPFALDTEGF
ncbi:MAG: VacJ family lipoprotein [Paracoccaceae bacterium]